MELRSVSKSYGSIRAVKDASLTIQAGSSLCVVGRNGSGKSTLLKIAGVVIEPDGGSLILDGTDLTKLSVTSREKIRSESFAYSFQEPLLVPYLNIVENVLLANPASGKPRSSELEARDVLSALELGERLTHVPSKLSGGEKKKVDLARAVVRKPRVLVADEPLSMLDSRSAEIVIGILRGFVKEGGCLVCSAVDEDQASWTDSILHLAS